MNAFVWNYVPQVLSEHTPGGSKTPEQWAEVFGRRSVNAMVNNAPIQHIEYWARLAGSYAHIALERREAERVATDVAAGMIHVP